MASMKVELNDKLQNGTAIALSNQTGSSMQLIRSHSWSGQFISVPSAIPNRSVSAFLHLKANDEGSTAAVSYSFKNAAGVPLAFVLAWSAPANLNPPASPNKVYGVCGGRSHIDGLSWDQIKLLLDIQAGSSVEINDGFCMNATILNNPATKIADLRANFQ